MKFLAVGGSTPILAQVPINAATAKVDLPEPIDTIEAMSAKPLFVSGWEVAGIRNAEKFFSALPEILPLPANLCFEGTSISSDVQALFTSKAVSPSLQIPPGTMWPKSRIFHVRATEQFLQQLAALAEKHAEPEVCDHFHAYNDAHGLMQWYDAFSGESLLVDATIPESSVQNFCRKLGVSYARWRASKYASHGPQEPESA